MLTYKKATYVSKESRPRGFIDSLIMDIERYKLNACTICVRVLMFWFWINEQI